MNPFLDPSSRTRSSYHAEAFTLIELLVVISIIAVLAGLLLPVVNKVMENARKTGAKAAVTQVVAAVNSYQTDYGQYPVISPPDTGYVAGSDYTFGTDGHNSQLFQVLRALNGNATDGSQALNSRRIVYFEGKNSKDNVKPRDGFVQAVGGTTSGGTSAGGTYPAVTGITLNSGDFVDPWGDCYLVRIDTSYSNAVKNPYVSGLTSATTTDATGDPDANLLHTGAIAYSNGLDGKPGPNGNTVPSPYTAIGDDVVSWQ